MNDALLQELLDAGTPPMLVMKVAQELGRAEGEMLALEKRRTADRARQQEKRDREKVDNHVMSRDVTDVTDAPPSLDKETSPRPPKEINPNPASIAPPRKGFPVPVGVTAEQWTSFTAQRKKKLNDRAYGLLCGKLETLARDGWPPGEMIDRAIEHGWETVFAPKGTQNGQRPANDRTEIQNPILRAGLARRARRDLGPGDEREGSSGLWG